MSIARTVPTATTANITILPRSYALYTPKCPANHNVMRIVHARGIATRRLPSACANRSAIPTLMRSAHPCAHEMQYAHANRLFVSSALRAMGHLVRTPLTAIGAGTGVAAYANYKFEQFHKAYVPDWFKDTLANGREALSDGDWVPDIGLFSGLAALAAKLASHDDDDDDNSTGTVVKRASSSGTASGKGTNGSGGNGDGSNPATAAAVAAAAAAAASTDENDDREQKPTSDSQEPAGVGLVLTKKMIEIRNLLRDVMPADQASLRLPGIVVIGSQSSGKSSVLEAMVGHEFLPKGSNMVTRRPIELTLVHTDKSSQEYCEFPKLGLGKIQNFAEVRKILTDMNMAVPEADCVSETPIYLNIYSPNVSDLTLVDLPGYIQVTNANQPPMLKEKISDLCDKYLYEDNIILAVSAADVDLANSEALRAARKADPHGKRTVGILTKMDMVEPAYGVQLINNKNYPLALGYVGVVCKYPKIERSGFFGTAQPASMAAAAKHEESIFSDKSYDGQREHLGTPQLKKLVENVLEKHIAQSLPRLSTTIRDELDDIQYQFKVHYNDRSISAESYVAETRDKLKQKFKELAESFGKPEIRNEVRQMLDSVVVDICEQQYWSDPLISTLPHVCLAATSPRWKEQLDFSSSALTKSGIGRSTVQLVVDKLMANMEQITSTDSWSHHTEGRAMVLSFARDILRSRMAIATDQVENTIKPYKYDVEILPSEWTTGQQRAIAILDGQIKENTTRLGHLKQQFGSRRLRSAAQYVQRLENAAIAAVDQGLGSESLGIRPELLEKAKTGNDNNGNIINDLDRGDAENNRGWMSYIFGGRGRDNGSGLVNDDSGSHDDGTTTRKVGGLTNGTDGQQQRTNNVDDSKLPFNTQRKLNTNLRFDSPAVTKDSSRLVTLPWSSRNPKVRSIMEDALGAAIAAGAASARLLEAGQTALALQRRSQVLQARLSAVKARQCGDLKNEVCCPEVYLAVVADKLAYTAVMFIAVELLNEFYFEVPKEIDSRFSYHSLGVKGTNSFAAENPSVQKHLQIQQRKETLESAMKGIRDLQRLNDSK